MKKVVKFSLIGLGLILLLGEVIGRYYGLRDYPTYIASDTFEYIHGPNQERLIYRNKFITNRFSMRSKPIEENDTTVVLLIGDSVINGGNLTDHDSLATTLLEQEISQELNQSIRVLNISAGSWGPDNAMNYIKEYGLFHADVIVLVVSSHDAYDNITHEQIVGIHPQFLTKNYSLAWGKLIERGWQQIEPYFPASSSKNSGKIKNSNLGISTASSFNEGFEYFKNISLEKNIPLMLYLHPSYAEMKAQKINKQGQEIFDFCSQNGLEIIDELSLGIQAADFRDQIHYSEKGQEFLANNLKMKLIGMLKKRGE